MKNFVVFYFHTVAPVISSLTELENRTSTVLSLVYYLNSTGGSTQLVYSLWYKSLDSDSSGVISDFLISESSGQVVHVDVDYLIPSTQYVFILGVHDEEDALFSDNITATGITNSKYKYLYTGYSIYHCSCLSLYTSSGRVDLTNCVSWFQLSLNPSTKQRKYFNHSVTYNPPYHMEQVV